ncbi:MAG: hypothetical protein HYR76_09670, partial [Ignavibacteria bacterium]|nr:hypothetical protein [Ignavibacteria bacterium]
QQATADKGQQAGAQPPPGGQAEPASSGQQKKDGKAVEDASFEVVDDKDKT